MAKQNTNTDRRSLQDCGGFSSAEYHSVGLSGGKDSSALLLLMLEEGMPIDSVTVIALLMVLFIHQVAIIYVAVVLVGFGAAGGALQTSLSVVQLFNPGPKGRNTGIYYTFMGIASYLVPVLASRLTIVSGEAAAVYTLMLLMVAFGVLEILSALFLVGQHKKIFGTNPLA